MQNGDLYEMAAPNALENTSGRMSPTCLERLFWEDGITGVLSQQSEDEQPTFTELLLQASSLAEAGRAP